MGLSQALYGFYSGAYDLPEFHIQWKEELHTPILNYHFKCVKINAYKYFEIKRRRRQVGLR